MTISSKTTDLHLHTIFSDGIDTPEQVVDLAKKEGLSAISITDHDNIEAFAVAAPCAAKQGIELLPGIEMSATSEGREVHVLGYLIDLEHSKLQAYLAYQKERRVGRIREIVKRLGKIGIHIDAEEIFALTPEGTVGRPHVAEILLRHGHIAKREEAFTRLIGPGNPAFIPGSPVPPGEVIRIIRDAGGVPVLAHPVYIRHDPLIDELIKEGLAGLEIFHEGHSRDLALHYEQIADRLHLLKTGGSDYHGKSKEGAPIGSVKAPYEFVEVLREWKRAHPSASCA